MAATKRKLTRQEVARFQAIRASQKARAAANDNADADAPRSAYVDTAMTPGMLTACVEAAGYPN